MSTLRTNIKFDIKNNKFTFVSEATDSGVKGIVENVLRVHTGAGADDSEPCIKDVYNISIHWDFSDDSFGIKSDTGNKSLTDGILISFLRTL